MSEIEGNVQAETVSPTFGVQRRNNYLRLAGGVIATVLLTACNSSMGITGTEVLVTSTNIPSATAPISATAALVEAAQISGSCPQGMVGREVTGRTDTVWRTCWEQGGYSQGGDIDACIRGSVYPSGEHINPNTLRTGEVICVKPNGSQEPIVSATPGPSTQTSESTAAIPPALTETPTPEPTQQEEKSSSESTTITPATHTEEAVTTTSKPIFSSPTPTKIHPEPTPIPITEKGDTGGGEMSLDIASFFLPLAGFAASALTVTAGLLRTEFVKKHIVGEGGNALAFLNFLINLRERRIRRQNGEDRQTGKEVEEKYKGERGNFNEELELKYQDALHRGTLF